MNFLQYPLSDLADCSAIDFPQQCEPNVSYIDCSGWSLSLSQSGFAAFSVADAAVAASSHVPLQTAVRRAKRRSAEPTLLPLREGSAGWIDKAGSAIQQL